MLNFNFLQEEIMNKVIIISIMALVCPFILKAQVHSLNELQPITINKGELLDYSTVISGVKINGEDAEIIVNLPNTSILAEGQHKLVVTAMTFSGYTETKETELNVGNSNSLSNPPQFTGVADHTFSEGELFRPAKDVAAVSGDGKKLKVAVNIKYPEHLAPGTHDIYFTAVDKNGVSSSEHALLTVNPVSDSLRKMEWARLGAFLYDKYIEPSRLDPYMKKDADGNITTNIFKAFSYSPTLHGITAELFYKDVKYDQLSFDALPIKIEPLMARVMMILKELHHHRFLWKDQQLVIVQVALRGTLDRSGETAYTKDRGIHAFRIPVSVFRKDNYQTYLTAALQGLSDMETKIVSRSDGKGFLTHKLYDDSDGTGIKIMYLQDLREGYYGAYKTEWQNGNVTFEENFNMQMYQNELDTLNARFKNWDFGCFTNPALPFIKQQSN
jgi:hypothetical protein